MQLKLGVEFNLAFDTTQIMLVDELRCTLVAIDDKLGSFGGVIYGLGKRWLSGSSWWCSN